MISVTKLDGAKIWINEWNIQWIESLPDTSITFVGGARILVKERPAEIALLMGSSSKVEEKPTISTEKQPESDELK
jgi:uncharacterized protein YlzI (FlbEa/FlbD family)